MKFRAVEQSIITSRRIEGPDWDRLSGEINSANGWLGTVKGRKAVSRLQSISEELEKRPIQDHIGRGGPCANCRARYREGLPISSSIAESAINQVVSERMAKKQEMRRSDEGAHLLALVRVADLNGELSIDSLGDVLLATPKRSREIVQYVSGVGGVAHGLDRSPLRRRN